MKTLIEKGYFKWHTYKVYRQLGHYELYIDDEFWSTGDSIKEIKEELENVY